MPIFEYKCSHCGKFLEHFSRTDGDKPDLCPNCGEPDGLEKLFSSFSAPTGAGASCEAGRCSEDMPCFGDGCCCHP